MKPPPPSKVPLQLKIDKNKSKSLKICAKLNNVYLAVMLHSAEQLLCPIIVSKHFCLT